MSVTVEHTVWCDLGECSVWITESGAKRSLLRAIKRDGWARRKINGRVIDLCPSCANKVEPPGRSA